jgi:hypothetical protein
LGRIPKRLLPYRQRSPGGAIAAVEGKIGECFVAALEAHTSATLAELKDGFKTIDKIRLELDKARNGANGAEKQTPAQTADRAAGANHNIHSPLLERDANLDWERTNDRRLIGNVIIAHALADCAALEVETGDLPETGNMIRQTIVR